MITPKWFDELNRMNQLLRDVMDSPVQRALRDVGQHREVLELASYRLLRDLDDGNTIALQKLSEKIATDRASIDLPVREMAIRSAAAARRFSETLTADFSSIIGRYETLKVLAVVPFPGNLAADLQRAFQAFQTPALPALESYADELRSISRNIDALRPFQEKFAGRLLEAAHRLAEAHEEEVDERATGLLALLRAYLAKSSGGPVSFEGYVQIVLTLSLFFASVDSARQSEKRIMEHLSSITAQLEEIGTREQTAVVPELRLVAAASLRIRSEPSGTSEVIGKLTRGALVRVISKEKRWARVEYFDFVEGDTATGWMAHQFLQMLPDEFWRDTPARQIDARTQAARERFERHFGEVDLGCATGVDNEQIDADLAAEYAGTDQPN